MDAPALIFPACREIEAQLAVATSRMVPHIQVMAPRDDRHPTSQAFGRALEELREPLIGYFARRVADRADAADLVQEVFLRLTTRGEAEKIEHLRSYVFQVAASVLADRHRRRTVRQADAHVTFDPDRAINTEIGPDRIVAGREALHAALAALQALPDRTRAIFVLRRLEGMAYREIAARFGISVSAVEKHMVKAVTHLATLEDLR